MKKILLLLVITGLGIAEVAAQKTATVDRQVILEGMPHRDSVMAKLEAEQQQFQMMLDQIQQDYMKLQQDFQEAQQGVQAGTVSPNILEIKGNLLVKKQEEFEKLNQSAPIKLQEYQMELMQPLIKLIEEATAAVAKEKGYDHVFDKSIGALVYTTSPDITEAVLAKVKSM